MPTPHQLVAQQAVLFVHRVISRQIPAQIFELLEFPARSSRITAPRLAILPRTHKGERSFIFEAVRVYANIDKSARELPEYLFIRYIKTHSINLAKNPT